MTSFRFFFILNTYRLYPSVEVFLCSTPHLNLSILQPWLFHLSKHTVISSIRQCVHQFTCYLALFTFKAFISIPHPLLKLDTPVGYSTSTVIHLSGKSRRPIKLPQVCHLPASIISTGNYGNGNKLTWPIRCHWRQNNTVIVSEIETFFGGVVVKITLSSPVTLVWRFCLLYNWSSLNEFSVSASATRLESVSIWSPSRSRGTSPSLRAISDTLKKSVSNWSLMPETYNTLLYTE